MNDLVVSPMDFVKKRGYQINGKYYCEQQINAPLERLFATCGVDIIVKELSMLGICWLILILSEMVREHAERNDEKPEHFWSYLFRNLTEAISYVVNKL